MARIIDYINNPWRIFLTLAARGYLNKMSDERFLKCLYRARLGEKLDLNNPMTLNEKFQWYKLNYRNPLMTTCADKVKVREYVKSYGLEDLLNEQYGVYNSFDEIDFSELPEMVYIKCNHNSGVNAIVNKRELTEAKKTQLGEAFAKGLRKNYYFHAREWAYKNIEPKLVCEKYLASSNGRPLVDINFFCFSGKVEMIYYNIGLADENGKHRLGRRAVLDKNFKFIPDARTQMETLREEDLFLPENMEEISRWAEQLSSPFPHARVDFFIVDDKAYFGEITFYSASGFMCLKPKELYNQLGEAFKLDIKNR